MSLARKVPSLNKQCGAKKLPSSSIQPFLCPEICILNGVLIFSYRTPLNMTFGGSFSPFAFTVRATMKLCLSAPHDNTGIACVASAKRGGGREKGKRKGSACSKSLCFCITPTNFLVIRLRLLSIKCRYTRHAEKHYTHGLKKFT